MVRTYYLHPAKQGLCLPCRDTRLASRYVVSWRLSNTLETVFCTEALENALLHSKPEIFNTDQGAQFTDEDFTGALKQHGIDISMDGKGRFMDNIFIERLWRSLKYEEVYLKAYESIRDARSSIAEWIRSYNFERPHQALNYQTPWDVYRGNSNQNAIDRMVSSVVS